MAILDTGCYQFKFMQMRYSICRLIKQETRLEYFRLRSLLTSLALQYRKKLSATWLASLLVIVTERKPALSKQLQKQC